MNKIFKVIWSKSRNCYVVASELAKGTSKSTSTGRMAKRAALAAVAALLLFPVGGYSYAADTATVTDTSGNQQTVYTKDGIDAGMESLQEGIQTFSTQVQASLQANADQFTTDKTSTALHVSKDGNLIVGTKENQVVKNMKINGQLTSGSLSTGDINSSGDVTVKGKMAADGVTDETTKDGTYIKQNNTVGNNLVSLDKQVKANDDRITAVKEYLQKEAADTYVSKNDAAVQDGAIVKAANTIGDNVTKLDAALASETAARIGADAAQDKVIQQVNDNLVASVNTINKSIETTNENMAAGFTALSQADANEAATREAADNALKQAMTDQKTSTALHVSKDGNLIVGTKENQVVKNMKINGQLTSGSISTGDINSSGDVTVKGKMAADGVTDETTKDGTYIKQNNTVGNNLVSLDTQVKANADAIAEKANATDVYTKAETDQKVDAANTYTYRKVAAEEKAREAADTELNERITNEANAIHETTNQLQTDLNTETIAREAADTALDTRITNVKEYLEKQTSDNYVSKADAAVQDGAVVKAANTIGENVANLDAALAKETAARIGADAAQDKVIQQVNQNMVDGFNTINKNMADGFTALNQADANEAAAREAADKVLDDKITAETSARVAADTKLVEAVNSGLSLSDDNVLQKNTTSIDAQGNVTTSKTDANEMILNKGKDNQITLNENGIKVGTNSTVVDKDGVYTGGDTYSEAKAAMSADGKIKGANGDFTVDENGNVTSKATITGETVTDGKGASMSNGTVTGKTLTDGIATITNGNINTSGTITGGTVTSTGNISALGDIHAGGAITGASASIQGALTAGSATITGDLTAGGAIQGKSISDGTATMQNGNLTGVKNLSAETITTSGDATIGGDLTVKGKLNVDEIDLTKNGIVGDNNVTASTKVAAGEITGYKKATSTKDGSEKESAIDYDENGTSTWAKSTDADGNWNKSTLTVKGSDVTSKVIDSEKNSNLSTQTSTQSQSTLKDKDSNTNTATQSATESSSVVTNKDGKTSTFKQNVDQILSQINDQNGVFSTIDQKLDGITSEVTDGTNSTKTEQNATDITNTAASGTITNAAKDIINNATENMTNTVGKDLTTTVGGEMKTTVTGKVTEDYKSDLDTKVGGNETHYVAGSQTNTVSGDRTVNVKGTETENFNAQVTSIKTDQRTSVGGNQTNIVAGNQQNTVSGSKTESVKGAVTETYGSQTTKVNGDQSTTVTGKQTNSITGDQVNTIGGSQTTTVTGDVTEDYKANLSTTVGGNQTTTVTGDSSLTAENITNEAKNKITNKAIDVETDASSSIVNKVSNDAGSNTSTQLSYQTKEEMSQADGKTASYLRGAAEEKSQLTDGDKKTTIDTVAGQTNTNITDGTNTSNDLQKADQIASSVTDGTNTTVVNQDAKSLASSITDGTKSNNTNNTVDKSEQLIKASDTQYSATSKTATKMEDALVSGSSIIDVIKNLDDAANPFISSAVTDGTNSTGVTQTAKDITNTAKNGTITNDAKDIINNATENMTNTVGKDLTTTVGGEMKTTVTGKVTEDYKSDLDTKVGGNETHYVEGNQTNTVSGDRTVSVKGTETENFNAQVTNVKTDQRTSVGGNQTNIVAGNQQNTVSGSKTETVKGSVTEKYGSQATTVDGDQSTHVGGNQSNVVAGDQTNTISGSKTETVKGAVSETYGSQTTKVNGDQSTTVTGKQTNSITGDQVNTIGGSQTTTVTGDVTEDYKANLSTTVGGNQTTTVTGDSSLTAENITNEAKNKITNKAIDVETDASSSIVNKVSNDAGSNTSTQLSYQTKEEMSQADGKTASYLRGAAEEKSQLTDGDKKTTIDTVAGQTNTNITDGTNTSNDLQKADQIASSVTDGTNTTVVNQDAKSLASSITDGTKSNNTNNTVDKSEQLIKASDTQYNAAVKTATTSTEKLVSGSIIDILKDADNGFVNTTVSTSDGTSSTSVKQGSADITNTAKQGTITNDAKNLVNTAEESITNTAGTQIQDVVGKTTVTTTTDGTTFENTDHNTAIGDGSITKTTISGNTLETGKATMDYAEVMKDLTVGGTTTTKDLHVTNNATIDGTLDVAGAANFQDTVTVAKDLSVGGNASVSGSMTASSYKVGDKTYIDDNGINANNQKITNVAAGELSANSLDAVNGSQLYETNRRVSKMDSRINEVGANAAAMANLHPLEFDADSKFNVAAAVGNYKNETATALGLFYRPNEDVMVNLSGTVGSDDNMIGGGVSVRIGRGGNKARNKQMAESAKYVKNLESQVNTLQHQMDALLSVLNPNLSKEFPDVPENHWAYEAVSRLAGNGIIQGYEDGKYHGERTMTRYEMAEIIYKALQKGAKAEAKLVEEFKPELKAMAAQNKA